MEEVCYLPHEGSGGSVASRWGTLGLQLSFFVVLHLLSSPMGCSSSGLQLQTKPHLGKETGYLPLHLIFFKVLSITILPGVSHMFVLHHWGGGSLGVSWMLGANRCYYHSLL